MRWFPRRGAKPARQSPLRLVALEAREVPAVLPQFWFLSSTWASARTSPVIPPTPAPTVPPPAAPTLALATASDTGTAGDRITTLSAVSFQGTTTPNVSVRLVQTGATTTADSTGAFQFANVPVSTGTNSFTVRASNSGGRAAQTISVTREAAPTLKTALAPISVAATGTASVDLAGSFDDADITNTRVRFDTSAGPINVELFDRQAPKTVANFLNYATDGDYTDAIFHRSAKLTGGVPFVLQGGGFTFETGTPPTIAPVPQDPAVQNEPDATNRSNLRGTIAMAKLGGDPNSATNQFFFNLGNNASILDGQNGGFTVFGKVVAPADQAIVDQLAAIPTQNQSTAAGLPTTQRGAFGEVPLTNYTGTNFPSDATRANFAIINGVSVVSQTEALTYSVVNNSNPAAATATITDNRLNVQGAGAGTTTLTIRATDQSGNTVETTVTVTVA